MRWFIRASLLALLSLSGAQGPDAVQREVGVPSDDGRPFGLSLGDQEPIERVLVLTRQGMPPVPRDGNIGQVWSGKSFEWTISSHSFSSGWSKSGAIRISPSRPPTFRGSSLFTR